jgi:HSP20 family protein
VEALLHDGRVSLWGEGGTPRIHFSGREREPPSPAFNGRWIGGMLKRSVEIFQLQDEINRIFSEILSHLKISSSEEYTWNPSLDVIETSDSIVILMEAPGLTEKDVSVHLSGRWLILEGEKPTVRHFQSPKFLCLERAYGKFYKAVPILVPFNSQAGRTLLQNGLLRISFPKVPERRKKTISLNVERP